METAAVAVSGRQDPGATEGQSRYLWNSPSPMSRQCNILNNNLAVNTKLCAWDKLGAIFFHCAEFRWRVYGESCL